MIVVWSTCSQDEFSSAQVNGQKYPEIVCQWLGGKGVIMHPQ